MPVISGDIESEWAARLPGLDRLWSMTRGLAEVRIAILDGPVDGHSLTEIAPDAAAAKHGTHVHSIICGSPSQAIPGLAPGCTSIPIEIFDTPGVDGTLTCSQARLAFCIREALAQRANVINISASQQADLLSLSGDLNSALQEALERDVLIVAAAGNQGCACDTIPASVRGVLAVGAHDESGEALLSSNWGLHARNQGILAPGRNVPGACAGGGLCRASGTSFAAAMVSGVAGLLMSVELNLGSTPSGRRVRKALIGSSVRPSEESEIASRHLSGRMDVSRALDHLLKALSSTTARGRVS